MVVLLTTIFIDQSLSLFFFVQIRLASGESPSSGRVEVRHNGVWGTICDDNFAVAEAQVVCRMLGYGNNVAATVYNGTEDFSGDGPIWIRFDDQRACRGDEASIEDCKVEEKNKA